MDRGRIVDDNSPYLLLEEESSYFSKLVAQTGLTLSTRLHESAKKHFLTKSCLQLNKSKTFLKQRNI